LRRHTADECAARIAAADADAAQATAQRLAARQACYAQHADAAAAWVVAQLMRADA
jgi:hypothetical protein